MLTCSSDIYEYIYAGKNTTSSVLQTSKNTYIQVRVHAHLHLKRLLLEDLFDDFLFIMEARLQVSDVELEEVKRCRARLTQHGSEPVRVKHERLMPLRLSIQSLSFNILSLNFPHPNILRLSIQSLSLNTLPSLSQSQHSVTQY